MSELLPYIGVALVIGATAFAVSAFARHGLRLKRFRHDKTELEFESPSASEIQRLETTLTDGTRICEAMIDLSELATKDCETIGIDKGVAIQFVLGEAARHPILFASRFSSIPFVFGENVLLLSWDDPRVTIERMLSRQRAYPLNDSWTSCLAIYRQATLLPYRMSGVDKLCISTEARRSLAVYRRLISRVKQYLQTLRKQGRDAPAAYRDLEALLEEAEFALANDDIGTSVARMEAVLSIAHKLILQFAPQGPLAAPRATVPEPDIQLPKREALAVLVVDDEEPSREVLRYILDSAGYRVVTASTSSIALKEIVENEFDFVITDLMMESVDGREVALAAKRSSSRTKVVVVSGFMNMARLAELPESGIDEVLEKPITLERITSTLRRLHGGTASHEESPEEGAQQDGRAVG